MEFNEAVTIREATIPYIQRIETVIQTLEKRKKPLATELEQLEDRFPSILAAFHIGSLTGEELNESRNRMKELREELSEIPLAIPALRNLQQPANEKLKAATEIIHNHERLQRYESYRDRIIKSGAVTDNEAAEFRLIAAHAGRSNEAEKLSHDLVYHAQRKSVDPDAVFTFAAA